MKLFVLLHFLLIFPNDSFKVNSNNRLKMNSNKCHSLYKHKSIIVLTEYKIFEDIYVNSNLIDDPITTNAILINLIVQVIVLGFYIRK